LLKNLWRDRQRSISQWFFSLSAISKNYFGLHDPGHALGRTRVCDGKEQPGARLLFINAPISRKQAPLEDSDILAAIDKIENVFTANVY